MTAIVGVLNKHAVAIAADSAVTLVSVSALTPCVLFQKSVPLHIHFN